MQSDVAVENNAITGTLKYLDSGSLVDTWGAGNFLALRFDGIDPAVTSAKVGLTPSEGSGLVELDADRNGVFKITDKDTQKFTVQLKVGSATVTHYYDLAGLTLLSE